MIPNMNELYQVVIDTNVFITALRSDRGASFLLLSLIGLKKFDFHISVPLILEYEEAARKIKWKGKPQWKYILDIIDYICLEGRHNKIHFLWRPRGRDLRDEMVLEVAVASNCNAIITYNKKDFAEAVSFGVELLTPKEFLIKIGELK